jgi:hypothetical protein
VQINFYGGYKMAILQKLDIVAARDRKQETVDVPEWGGEVIVSELGAADYVSLFATPELFLSENDGKNISMAKFAPALVAKCIVDPEGNRIFSDEDAEILAQKSVIPFGRVSTVAFRLNKMAAQENKDESTA